LAFVILLAFVIGPSSFERASMDHPHIETSEPKKPYTHPELIVYGPLALTQNTGPNGNADGGEDPGQMSSQA
jgi:hypothetical protein